jgi:two-component system, LytTR family, sensor kinase
MIHPLLINLRNLAIYALFWLLLTACWAGLSFFYFRSPIGLAITDSVVYNFSFAILSIGLWYTVRYSNLEKLNIVNRFLHHIVEAIIIAGAWFLVCYLILRTLFSTNHDYLAKQLASIPIIIGVGLIYYTVSTMFYYLVISYRNLQEKIQHESELKALVKETELSLLKSQINPHFLFNSLNSISSLTITNPAKAQEMIIKLSEFLRHSIGHKEDQMVALRAEIDQIMLYLDIEKIRFGERLRYDFKINPQCMEFLVPAMILQPLFENAIKHGVYESTEEVTITFNCQPKAEGMNIRLSNNFDPEAPPRKGNQMGIRNIVSRLKLIYQRDDLLKISKSQNNFDLEITLPYPI